MSRYWKILEHFKDKNTIQLGDLGFKDMYECVHKLESKNTHKGIKGNHDYYPYLYDDRFCLGDYSYFKDMDMMCIRGANSMDIHQRKEGVDWFREEEVSYEKSQEIIDFYIEKKPQIVITHDCPYSIKLRLFQYHDKTITSNMLECMFQNHQPKLWIFGHYHRSMDTIVNGTRFVCLKELETLKNTILQENYNKYSCRES